MNRLVFEALKLVLVVTVLATGCARPQAPQSPANTPAPNTRADWQVQFDLSSCTMMTTGKNKHFILEPGFQLKLEGGNEVLIITVLDETVNIDGIDTRIVEEREWRNGEIIEISKNYFAICEETKDIYYFGEEVDMYQGGMLASHSGAWRSGEENAKFGLIMPGEPTLGMKYYQEFAPAVAMDRAEIVSLNETLATPAGSFPNSLKTKEGTALNLLEIEYKTYAPEIGLIQDGNLLLTEYGFIENE